MPGVTSTQGQVIQLPKGDISSRLQVLVIVPYNYLKAADLVIWCLLPSILLFRTYKQIDFDAVRLAGCTKPARALRPADSGIVLGTSPSSSLPLQAHAQAADALPKQVCHVQCKAWSCLLALPAQGFILLAAFCTCLLPSLGSLKFDLLCCLTQSNFRVAELLKRLNGCVIGNIQIAFDRRNNARFSWHYFACI